jgi:transposase
MLNESKPNVSQEKLEELQNFIDRTKDIREWKRAQSVKLRLQGFSYREIEKRLEVSISFIAQTQRKYISQGLAGLKLKYRGSKSYLTSQQLCETMQWLSQPENRNISDLERYLMSNYDVVFKSPESYYILLKISRSHRKHERLTGKFCRVLSATSILFNRGIATQTSLGFTCWPSS